MLSGATFMGAHASVDDTIKVAVIGCGGRGTGASFPAIASGANIKIVALADDFRDRLDEAYSKISEPHSEKVTSPGDRKFCGFDAYKKVLPFDEWAVFETAPGF